MDTPELGLDLGIEVAASGHYFVVYRVEDSERVCLDVQQGGVLGVLAVGVVEEVEGLL